MTEQMTANNLQFAGGGTPETPAPAAPGQPTGQAPQNEGAAPSAQYATLDQVAELLRKELASFRDSTADRTANRVTKILQQASAKGVQVDPEQARAILSVIDEENAGQGKPPAPPAAPAQASPAVTSTPTAPNQATGEGGTASPVHPVILAADAMLQRAGLTIDPEDPELSLIDQKTTDEIEFLTSIKAAIAAKQQRLAAKGTPARMPATSSAAKPGNPVTGINDPDELWRLAMK